MKRILFAASAIFGLATAFENTCNHNIVGYWGQNSYGAANGQDTSGWQRPISFYCDDDSIDVFPISFLTTFFGPDGSPQINLANTCNSVDNATFPGTTLANCGTMAPDIKYCQSKGKLVTLSLGGATGGAGFQSEDQALSFADTIWHMFLGGSSSTRPFGDAVLDGIDLDIEGGGSNHYITFLEKLKSYFPSESKKYYITAAPQCVFPDANLQATLNNFPFDAIYVQFYNNPCGLQYYNTNQWNFGVWDNWARTSSSNPNVKIYIGAPASSSAAGSGYVTAASLLEIALQTRSNFPSFGGVMFWDVSQAHGNDKFGHFLKNGLSPDSSCSGEFNYPLCTAPAYTSGKGYSGGSTVSHNGYIWTARWYASSAPSNDPYSEWLPVMACSFEGTNTASPKLPPAVDTNPSKTFSALPKITSYSASQTAKSSAFPRISSSVAPQVSQSSVSKPISLLTTTIAATTTAIPMPMPKPSLCTSITPWSSSEVYTGGNNAYYDGAIWKAKWWSQNDIPGGTVGVWEKIKSCETEILLSAQSILEAASQINCKRNVAKWNRLRRYREGSRVIYRGAVYVASNTNHNQKPNMDLISWEKGGDCF